MMFFDLGDFVFIKDNSNGWSLKQYPNVNGGIVALDPYTGEVKALVGVFSYVSSEFNRVTQAKASTWIILNLLFMLLQLKMVYLQILSF